MTNVKRLLPFSIQLNLISASIPRNHFSEEIINKIAEESIKLGGLIRPVVVRRTEEKRYEVIHGFLQYYVALRVQEINSALGEYVLAFVADTNNEESIIAQIDLLTYPFAII